MKNRVNFAEQASEETCFSYKLFILLVLVLVYYSFLQVTRGNFIGKYSFRYIVAKLQMKMERNFYQRLFYVFGKESPPWTFS